MSSALSRFNFRTDSGQLINFVNGGEKARKIIQKQPKPYRGTFAIEYQIEEDETDMAYFWTSKYAFEARTTLGVKFDKNTILEDLEAFVETVEKNFSATVHNSDVEVVSMPKSHTRTLIVSYRNSKVMIDILKYGHSKGDRASGGDHPKGDRVEGHSKPEGEESPSKRIRLDSLSEDQVLANPPATLEKDGKAFYLQVKKIREDYLEKERLEKERLERERLERLEKEKLIGKYTSELETLIRANASAGRLEVVMTDVPIAEIPLVMDIYRKYASYGFVMNTEKKDIVEFTW